jgi:hypothetical protein
MSLFLRVLSLTAVVCSLTCREGWAAPSISTFDDVENLLNKGIRHQDDFYSVQVFPRGASKEVLPSGFYRETASESPHVSSPFVPFFYDGYEHDKHQRQDRIQEPRNRYLNLLRQANATFKDEMLGSVFAVEITSQDTTILPNHYLIPRITKLYPDRSTAQEVEMGIRMLKLELQDDNLYWPSQANFIYKTIGYIDPKDPSWDFDTHAVIPFKDYLKGLSEGEKVKVLVGRGQLSSNQEPYNQPLSSSIVLPEGYHPYTIDIDRNQIPHLHADITNAAHLQEIPDGSVDEFYFDGVTYDKVYAPNSGLYEVLGSKLKVGGRVITNWGILNEAKLLENGFGEVQRLNPQEDYFKSFSRYAIKIQ